MNQPSPGPDRAAGSPAQGRRQLLAQLEHALRQASELVWQLRQLEDAESGLATALVAPAAPVAPAAEAAGGPNGRAVENRDEGLAAFERVWERLNSERLEQQQQGPVESEERRGLDLLPQQFLITIEDRDSQLDLVPLHRALQDLGPMDDFSLVSYVNGVPVISFRSTSSFPIQRLGEVVGAAFERDCEVIDQENGKLFLRLTPKAGSN
jgi:hypothetical protein